MKNNKWHDTIFVLIAVLLLLFVFVQKVVFVYSAVCLTLVALFIPSLGRLVHRLWFILAEFLGAVFGKIFLIFVYIIFVIPLALIFRKKSSLNLKLRNDSYFRNRNHQFGKKDMENPW